MSLGIERRKDIAEVIVRRRAMAKRQEPAQKTELLLAEAGDIDERLRSAQHREQTQQQHLVAQINDFATLALVRQIPEIIQKTMLSPIAPHSAAAPSIPVLRKPNQRITTDSALHPFVTHGFTRLPWPTVAPLLTLLHYP